MDVITDVKSFYRVQQYFLILDTIKQRFGERFSENDLSIVGDFEVVFQGPSMNGTENAPLNQDDASTDEGLRQACERLANQYPQLISNNILPESILMRNMFQHESSSKTQRSPVPMRQITDKFRTMQMWDMFPTLHKLLKIYWTLPISSATAERSFSVVKRLKTYLRNSMGQERLSSLALIAIEKEFDFNISDLIARFSNRCDRHLKLN